MVYIIWESRVFEFKNILVSYNFFFTWQTSSVYTQAPITTTFQLGMYSMFEREFYGRLSGAGQEGRISLHEFVRDGWTYHAKGLWYYPPGQDSPTLTLVGSSNFSETSVLNFFYTVFLYLFGCTAC